MSNVVLDASALLALLNREPGGDIVLASLATALMSSVNVAEVVSRLADRGDDEASIRKTLRELPVQVVQFDKELAIKAGLLRNATRSVGLSFGDRCCLALAQEVGLPVLTADRIWGQLNLSGITVQVIR